MRDTLPDNEQPQSSIVLYQTEDGQTRIQCRFANETIWLTQALIAELFQTTPQNVTLHLKAIFAEGELSKGATCKESLQVRSEGSREVTRKLRHYSLPASPRRFSGQRLRRRRPAPRFVQNSDPLEHAMKTLPLSEAKAKLSRLVERVCAHDEVVMITKYGRAAAILVSPSEFESWKETIVIRGDPALMREIKSGLAGLKARKAKLYTLEELLR